MKRAAIVGLFLLAASAAQAQAPDSALSHRANGSIGGPLGGGDAASDRTPRRGPSNAPAPPATPCNVVSKTGGQTPLPGFDPSKKATPLPQAKADPMMVMCDRASIVPEVTDYRVLTEMQLPFVIRVGQRLLVLGAKDGQFQFSMERGAPTPAETDALNARRDEMQKAAGAALQ